MKNSIDTRFFNRELSWMEFNSRVLTLAEDSSTPLLERVRFLTIFWSNLDEFFMVRVAGKKKAKLEELDYTDSPDNLGHKEVLALIFEKTKDLVNRANILLKKDVLPLLAKEKIFLRKYEHLKKPQKSFIKKYFHSNIYPVLTPRAVDPAHPFPFLTNLSLYLLVSFDDDDLDFLSKPLAFVEVPSVLPRLIKVPSENSNTLEFILLEDIISEFISALFSGFSIKKIYPIKVTRNLDFTLLESEVVDLLQSVQKKVKNRDMAEAVRLEIQENLPEELISYLKKNLDLQDEDIYLMPNPVSIKGFERLSSLPIEHLKEKPFNPRLPPEFKDKNEIFTLIGKKDLLIHHPYESFYAVIEFIAVAAKDPNVLAIKQTLYRTSGDSPIIDALIQAAENGKQVTAVVELKARFDEKNNIVWARRLENAGVNVVYGFIGLKTHAKTTLIIRQEEEHLKCYVHLSTGNYNSSTAKAYVDIGLITADQSIGQDICKLFNILTGFNILAEEEKFKKNTPTFNKIFISPLNLESTFINLIDEEIQNMNTHGQGYIKGKMNALVDKFIIEKLYEASKMGVKIDLIVRGICCLKPGVPGMSENIRVISILDRFLEHSRIYYFYAGGEEKVFLSSADLMPRNLKRRVELLVPIESKPLKERLVKKIMDKYWKDNQKSFQLFPDGVYRKIAKSDEVPIKVQEFFIDEIRKKGIKSIPYEEAIWHNPKQGIVRPIYQLKKK